MLVMNHKITILGMMRTSLSTLLIWIQIHVLLCVLIHVLIQVLIQVLLLLLQNIKGNINQKNGGKQAYSSYDDGCNSQFPGVH